MILKRRLFRYEDSIGPLMDKNKHGNPEKTRLSQYMQQHILPHCSLEENQIKLKIPRIRYTRTKTRFNIYLAGGRRN
ncbi:Hypothetical predicted protein [Scomber scombrus]|uniref:Uncharacterized protein n=1 Tax=Scomber scombrus TaxID=13677 RepID=A0AAV1PW55_SCOSC